MTKSLAQPHNDRIPGSKDPRKYPNENEATVNSFWKWKMADDELASEFDAIVLGTGNCHGDLSQKIETASI